ncbi:MAG: flagellar export chaperone FliS [Bryobacteraceae bacterium]|jgi:flagellar protein FliS
MYSSANDAYLESRVLSADPVELVRLLYQAAADAVRNARRQLAAGDIAARSRAISKASAIVIELAASLDHERGEGIAFRLAQLYDYIERRLIQANIQQDDAPLAEVLGLLATLSEAWEGVRQRPQPADRPVTPWTPPPPQEQAFAYSPQSWSA